MKKIATILFAVVMLFSCLATSIVAEDAPEAATATIYVMYSFPNLTGVTLNVMAEGDAEKTVLASTTTSATSDTGEAIIFLPNVTETKDYIVEAVYEGTTFTKPSDTIKVTVTLDEENNKYTARAEEYAVIYSGYTRTVIDESFDNVTVSGSTVTGDYGTFTTTRDTITLEKTVEDELTAVKTAGSNDNDNDGLRTKQFTLHKDALYKIETKVKAISSDEVELTWWNGAIFYDINRTETDTNYTIRPALKYWHHRNSDNWEGYEWVDSYYGLQTANGATVNAKYASDDLTAEGSKFKDIMSNLPNGYNDGAQNYQTGTIDQWGTGTINFIPSNTIEKAVLEIHAFDGGKNPFTYEGKDYEARFLPHFYVDYVKVTETVLAPAQPNPEDIPNVPANDPATATAIVYVYYNIPGMTGVTFELEGLSDSVTASSQVTTEESGFAYIKLWGLTTADAADYNVVAVKDGVTFTTGDTVKIDVIRQEVQPEEEGDGEPAPVAEEAPAAPVEYEYVATVIYGGEDDCAVINTGFTRTIIDDNFDRVSINDGIVTGENGVSLTSSHNDLKLNATTIGDRTVIETTGSKHGNGDTVRTPSFNMVKDRLYQIKATMAIVEVDENPVIKSHDYYNGYERYVIHDTKDGKVLVQPALKFFRNGNYDSWVADYERDTEGTNPKYDYNYVKNEANGLSEFMTIVNNNYQDAAQNWYDNTNEGVWFDAVINYVPANSISNVVLDIYANDGIINSDSSDWAEASKVIPADDPLKEKYDQLCYFPYFYIDSIVITETTLSPAALEEIPEIPAELKEAAEAEQLPVKPTDSGIIKMTGWFCTGTKYHAMLVGRAIITLPHEYNAEGECKYCGYNPNSEDVVVENLYESTEEETEDTEAPEEDNPDTGVALAILPAMLATAVIIAKKK